MIKHICFILDFYPTEDNHSCIFAKNLIHEIADEGVKCTVISPQIITRESLSKRYRYKRIDYTKNGNIIDVYMPYYLYLSSNRRTIRFSMMNHFRSVMRVIEKQNIKPDAVYGHFLYQCGLTAARVGKEMNIPSFCACGENSTRLMKNSKPYSTGLEFANWNGIAKNLSGIIGLSSYNKQLLVENGYVDSDENISVFPNGVDTEVFKPISKAEARDKLGLPQDEFIIVFNGEYSERKGFGVLCKVLNRLEDVYSIFIGSDEIRPTCKNVLFSGRLQHEEIPQYLNAADVMVLPTLGEGCCNAIVEALACRVPIISSDLPFNYDILNSSNSILVNPQDENEVKDAIIRIKNGEVELNTESNSDYSIATRTHKILKFITERSSGKN